MVSKDKDSDFRNNFISIRFEECSFSSLRRDRMSKCSQVGIFDPSATVQYYGYLRRNPDDAPDTISPASTSGWQR